MKFNIITLPKVASTNSYAQEQIEAGTLHEGDVIFTLNQQSGRGQGENIWESEAGSNLHLSLILEPNKIHASNQFVLTQLVSLAIISIIKNYVSTIDNNYDVKIKWPNDIYVGDKKIAGILFQNYIKASNIESSIVGIGINVNQLKFFSSAPNPISIINLINKQTDISVLLHELLANIGINYKKYSDEKNFDALKKEYLTNLYQQNIWTNYTDATGAFLGKIINVDKYGRLIIQLKNGEKRTYMFKEVAFSPPLK